MTCVARLPSARINIHICKRMPVIQSTLKRKHADISQPLPKRGRSSIPEQTLSDRQQLYMDFIASRSRKRHLTRREQHDAVRGSSRFVQGNSIMYSMNRTLERLDTVNYYRSYMQRLAHQIILSGLASLIYGPSKDDHELEILERNGFKSLRRIIGMTMPRRGGKSECTAQIIAVCLLCIPNIKIVSVAPSTRAAGVDSGLLGHVSRILRKLLGCRNFERNKEKLWIEKSKTDTREFYAYPGGAADK